MVTKKRKEAEAAVAAGAIARPRGAAPRGFPDWDGQRGVWTNGDGGTRAPGGKAASSAAASSTTAQPAAQQPQPAPEGWEDREEEWAQLVQSADRRRAHAARMHLKPMAGPITHEHIIPYEQGMNEVSLPVFDSFYSPSVRDRLRNLGVLGSMFGPEPHSQSEYLSNCALGRQRRWSF